MNKNSNHPMNDIINEFTEKFGDKEVRMTFRTVKEGMDSYFGLIEMTAELVRLIRADKVRRRAAFPVHPQVRVQRRLSLCGG